MNFVVQQSPSSIWFNPREETEIKLCKILIKVVLKNTNFIILQCFAAGKSEQTILQPVSLANIGLNCYLNASMQSIVACTSFVREMKNLEQTYPEAINLRMFNKVLTLLSSNIDESVDLSSISILRNWNKPGEQDTFELLSHIICQVYNELKSIHQSPLPKNERTLDNWIKVPLPMRLSVEFKIQCNCGHSYKPSVQADLALHLPIPVKIFKDNNPLTIDDLIDSYFTEEMLHDCECFNVDCKNPTISKFTILKRPLPSTLCIHIQRSFWNANLGIMEKVNEPVKFSESLILKNEFFLDGSNRKPKRKNLEEAFRNFQDKCIQDISLNSQSIQNDQKLSSAIKQTLQDNVKDDESSSDMYRLYSEKSELENITECSEINEESADNVTNNNSVEISGNMDSFKIAEIANLSECDSDEVSWKDCGKIVNNSELELITKAVNISQNYDDSSLVNVLSSDTSSPSNGITDLNKKRETFVIETTNHHSSLLNEKENNNGICNVAVSVSSDSQLNSSIQNEKYKLMSVIVHFGRADSGHYICYRRCGKKWFCANDSFITEIPLEDVLRCQAYILIYEKE